MVAFIPRRLKTFVPGYRRRHYRGHAALIAAIDAAWPGLELGHDARGPWLKVVGEKLHLFGMAPEPKNRELYHLLRPALPQHLPLSHFRVVKDYVTRYLYPHMRPDLWPEVSAADQLDGFHAQHRDNVSSIADPEARRRFLQAFRPRPDDVVIDCGAFLGFGSVRMARDVPQGRVFAVEASRECHALLKRNAEINCANVVPLHRGIWNTAGRLSLQTTVAQANSFVSDVIAGDRHEAVDTVTIDALVAEHRLDRLDMLSLTLNGAEVEALQGASESLARLRPRVRAAGWYMRDARRICDLIRPQLERAGYDVFVGPRGNVMALPREAA